MRTSSSPARARRISQGYWRFRRGAPVLRPEITHGLPGVLGRSAITSAAAGERGTSLAPVLVSVG